MTIKFEVGKKYKFRNFSGWARFIAHVPEAMVTSRLVFVDDKGRVLERFENGEDICADLYDILPEEYGEPKKKVMVYPALRYDDGCGYWISSSLFQTEEEARTSHGRTFVRLLTDRGVEVEE